jgi:hypothetical protein
MQNKVAHLFAAIFLFIASCFLIARTNKLEIPECKDTKVQSLVIALWKIQALKNSESLRDGRLSEPIEDPMNVANGRSCTATIIVDGKLFVSIGYTVFSPSGGGQDIVILN